jgi:hypothetical protein
MFLFEDELAIIESAKEYLTAFLSNYGEFYPFAMIMDKSKQIFPLEHEITEEHPNPDSLINLYEQTFENEINHEYVLGILCVNVIIRSKDTDKKRDAIEIRLTGANYRKKVLQYYKLEHKKVIYQELVGG